MKTNLFLKLPFLVLMISALNLGCKKGTIELKESDVDISKTSDVSKVTTKSLLYSGFDNSGKVEVRIWADNFDGQYPHGEVSVDPDFVLIGGGARVSDFNNSSNNVNALLTSCYPKDDGTFTTFIADSKDHIIVYNHRLWVYAIGMKLYDATGLPLPKSSLVPYMNISKTISGVAPHPVAISNSVLPGHFVLSGGAKVNWSGAGNLLTKTCFPTLGGSINQWEAASKDHVVSSPATIESYILSIDPSISNFGTLQIMYKYGAVNTNNNFMSVTQSTYYPGPPGPDNLLLAGVGGWSQYSGNGRLLFAIYPTSLYSANVRSKDHRYADQSGSLAICITMIRKQ